MEPQASLVKEDYLAIAGKELPAAGVGDSDEDRELARIKKLEITSPDLFPNYDGFRGYVNAGQSEIVGYLLAKGCDPNFQGVLESAVTVGNLAMVEQLLEAGACRIRVAFSLGLGRDTLESVLPGGLGLRS